MTIILQGFSLRICVKLGFHTPLLKSEIEIQKSEEYPDSRSKEQTQAVPMNC